MSAIFHFLYTHVPPWAIIAVVSHLTILGTVAYLILLERKIASWTQDRIGPNRVGLDFGILPFKFLKKVNGLGQPLADGLKFILKEDYKPKGVDVVLFTIAPAVMIIVIIISIAVIPWGGTKVTTRDIDITNAEQVDDVAAVDANIVASGELHKPAAQTVPVSNILGDRFWVTYKTTDAAGQTRQFHRFVDLSKHQGKDPTAVLREHLPAGAAIINPPSPATPTGTAPLSAVPTAAVVYPVELVRDADGTVRHVANNVTYSWLFAAGQLNIGVLYILAVLSLAVYGVVVGGWASNNKYSFLGGLRATANMISYEIPLGLVILCVVLIHGTLDMHKIVESQAGYWGYVIPAWNVFTQPLAFVLFVICIHAEANRAPFDTAEAEQELVGGYHTEYSAMRFALFFLAEYAGMITTSAVCVALFLGGWHLPYLELIPGVGSYLGGGIDPAHPALIDNIWGCFVRAGVFFGKTVGIIFVFMWVRWSLPRFRFDQIMILAWRALIPISLALLMVTATTVYLTSPTDNSGLPIRVPFGTAVALFVANVVVLVGAMLLSTVLPQPAATNRRIRMLGSRFMNTPLPGKPVASV